MLQSSSAVGKGDPSDIGMIKRWASGVALGAAVSVMYFLAAQLSLRLLMQPDGVAVFWLSGGITSGVLIALGPRARWPVAAGAVAGDLVPSLLSGWAAVAVGLCNAAEALIAAGLIQYYFGTSFTLSRLRPVAGFLVAAVVATMISGVGGAHCLQAVRYPDGPDSDDLVALVRVRCPRHHIARPSRDRCRGRPAGAAATQRAHRGRRRARAVSRDDRYHHLPAAPALGDCGTERAAVSDAAVARRPLPAGLRRRRRLRGRLHGRLDDDLRHRSLRRPRSTDRGSDSAGSGCHHGRDGWFFRPGCAVRRAASARGLAGGERKDSARGAGGRGGNGVRVECVHRFGAAE